MWNFIKRLGEVQQNGINLLASVKSCCKGVHCDEYLGLTGSSLPEAVLMITFQELHKMTVDYIFHDLTASRGQGYWSVVASISFLV